MAIYFNLIWMKDLCGLGIEPGLSALAALFYFIENVYICRLHFCMHRETVSKT